MELLLVEDNPADARLVREMLRDGTGDVELCEAERLNLAVERLERGAIDVVLLDLSLPDADGIEGVEEIAMVAPSVPIVVLTGRPQESGAVEALRAGAQDYLVKGEVAGPLLIRTLQYAIERKRLQIADHFLAQAGRLLVGTLEYEETLGRIGELAVESLADLCIVDLVDHEGELSRLHVWHGPSVEADLARQFKDFPLDRSRPYLLEEALEARRPVLVALLEDGQLQKLAQNEDHLRILRRLSPRSFIVAPLVAREAVLGAILLFSRHRSYSAHELAIAERLAHVAALQIDNAALYRRAQEAIHARDGVLGVVAHDLRNPLSNIRMVTDLLLELCGSRDQVARQLQIVRRSAEHMDRLIHDLLDVARIDGDHLVLDLEPEDPEALACETIERNGAVAAAKSIRLELEVEGNPGPVMVDHERVIRILENLVGNAIKFTPEGGRVTIRVAPAEDESEVRISVVDTGPGISAEELPNLFRPFWQSRGSSGSGAGLGLAIAKGLVDALGGRIWAESTPGAGTTMSFTLPAAEERQLLRV